MSMQLLCLVSHLSETMVHWGQAWQHKISLICDQTQFQVTRSRKAARLTQCKFSFHDLNGTPSLIQRGCLLAEHTHPIGLHRVHIPIGIVVHLLVDVADGFEAQGGGLILAQNFINAAQLCKRERRHLERPLLPGTWSRHCWSFIPFRCIKRPVQIILSCSLHAFSRNTLYS